VYETVPVGGPPQGNYLNACALIRTTQVPTALLRSLKAIERRLGREVRSRNSPRTIDLDLIMYGDLLCEEDQLTIPHARMLDREFVLQPATDLVPDWIHPKTSRSIAAHREQ
jgi:2-amino-4-hydroxy-6-hydroxymethyldihydropteridine diphosphokinase